MLLLTHYCQDLLKMVVLTPAWPLRASKERGMLTLTAAEDAPVAKAYLLQ